MSKAEIIEVKLSDIKLNPNNPRLIKDDKFKKLVKSIKEFPQMLKIRPIVVNSDMVILGGNMRYKACKEAGMKEVSIIVADNLTEDQQREFLIKDNVSGGEWDWEVLSNEWDTEQLEGWGLDVWIPEDIDLDEFFNDPENDGSSKKGKIVLEYSEDEYDKVVAAFDKINGSKEQIVWKFLNLDEE